jgi:hypothetical protein
MWSLIAIGILAGAFLGLRFTVLVLMPASIAGCALAAFAFTPGDGIADPLENLSALGVALVAVIVSLQIGYLCGVGLRLIVGTTATTSLPAAPSLPASARSPYLH